MGCAYKVQLSQVTAWPRHHCTTVGHQPVAAAGRNASKQLCSAAREAPQAVALHKSRASQGSFSKEKNKLIGFVG